MIDESGFVELGLVFSETCQSFERGMKAKGVYQPGSPILEAIEQLTT